MGRYETIDVIKKEINLTELNQLLESVGEKTFTTAQVASKLDSCERSVSKHLNSLVYSGFLESERVYKDGKVFSVNYRVNRQLIANIQNLLYYRFIGGENND